MTSSVQKRIVVAAKDTNQPGGFVTISGAATRKTTLNDDQDEILSVGIEPMGTLKIGQMYQHVSAETLDAVIEVATALRDYIRPKPEEPEPEPLTAVERLQQLIDKTKDLLKGSTDASNQSYYNGLLSGYENALLLIQQEDADELG